jgi:class 3 adenylate cyclase
MADRVPPGSAHASRRSSEPQDGSPRHAHEPHLTGEQISAINRFPDDNPNPVLRIDDDGRLMYANPASAGILRALGAEIGKPLDPDRLESLAASAASRGSIEIVADRRTFALWPVPIRELGFTNVYGQDVTAARAIARFPDQNPNPVLRIDGKGMLLYANPACAVLVASLGLELDGLLPDELRQALLERSRAADPSSVEVEAGDRVYSLLPVEVGDFGFVNVYGTDVTAVRERERLAQENERLLLNILPGPIAQRLRDGEPLIADAFEDVTLLFADIVEFTSMSSKMSPSELVGVLNEVFSVFDVLVDRHGLEKVKTIGDAYMVVGGIPEGDGGHTARVAAMALDLSEAVGRIEAAVRFGVRFRIGMHCGPVVAGVIGRKKFIYDVWGDTVNLASRMESLGMPGRIQVTHAVRERLADTFTFESRGLVEVKGKGPTPTYYLTGRLAPTGRTARGRAGWEPATRPA